MCFEKKLPVLLIENGAFIITVFIGNGAWTDFEKDFTGRRNFERLTEVLRFVV
jgi:hypothetical protein